MRVIQLSVSNVDFAVISGFPASHLLRNGTGKDIEGLFSMLTLRKHIPFP